MKRFMAVAAFLASGGVAALPVAARAQSSVPASVQVRSIPHGTVKAHAYTSKSLRTDRRIVVGDYTFIAHEVVIADEAAPVPPDVGDGDAPPPGPEEISVRIGENVWIGARAILLGGADVGEGAVVGAAAVVDGVVPPFAIAAGNPARVVGSVRP